MDRKDRLIYDMEMKVTDLQEKLLRSKESTEDVLLQKKEMAERMGKNKAE